MDDRNIVKQAAGGVAERGAIRLFISYSRADQKKAQPVITLLEQAGFQVWWDGLLEGGVNYLPETEAALESAHAIVVLWSKTSVASHWVRDEAARARDRRCLVPLSIDGSEPPLGFRQFQVIDFSKWKGAAQAPEATRLISAIAHIAAATPVASPKPAVNPTRRRLLVGAAAGAGLTAAAAFVWPLVRPRLSGTVMQNSIAVLPFKNLSGDPAQEYFSDGLSEELRSALARNAQLRVLAQTSSRKIRDSEDDAAAMADQIGVAYLLDGSVRRANDNTRITAELIDGKTGFSKWSQSFDRTAADIFAIQEEIANTVSRVLQIRMAMSDEEDQASGGTRNTEAFDAYLRGRSLYDSSSGEEDDRAALAQFDAAIALDPAYAAPHAARSRTLIAIAGSYASSHRLKQMHEQALASARQAVALAPAYAEAHSTLGYTLFKSLLDMRAAKSPLEKSVALSPGEATVQARYALFAAVTGQAQKAKAAIDRAVELDPFGPNIHHSQGYIRYAARDYALVEDSMQAALRLNPKMGGTYSLMAASQLHLKQLDRVAETLKSEPNSLFGLPVAAIFAYRTGDVSGAREALATLTQTYGDAALFQQAQVLAQLAEPNDALARLEAALAAGDSGMIFLRTDPFLEPLRTQPRFEALLARLGFEP